MKLASDFQNRDLAVLSRNSRNSAPPLPYSTDFRICFFISSTDLPFSAIRHCFTRVELHLSLPAHDVLRNARKDEPLRRDVKQPKVSPMQTAQPLPAVAPYDVKTSASPEAELASMPSPHTASNFNRSSQRIPARSRWKESLGWLPR